MCKGLCCCCPNCGKCQGSWTRESSSAAAAAGVAIALSGAVRANFLTSHSLTATGLLLGCICGPGAYRIDDLSRALFLWAAAVTAAGGSGASRRERRLLGLAPYQRGQISQGNCHNFQLGNEKRNKIKSTNAANDKTDCGIDKYKDVQREGETEMQKGRQSGGRADGETDRETDRQRQ